MKLHYRLSLSYLAVVFVFLAASGAIWIPLSGGPTYRLARREVQQWVQGLVHQARQAYAQGGAEGVVHTLRLTHPPPDTELMLFDSMIHGQPIWGDGLAPPVEQLKQAFQGVQTTHMPSRRGSEYKAILCVPMEDRTRATPTPPPEGGTRVTPPPPPEGGARAVLVLAIPVRLSPDVRSFITRGVLQAVAGGAAVSLALAWLLSYRIARPVENLTATARLLGQGDLSGRVEPGGSGELAEMATQFNRMAESLQHTVEQLNQEKASQRQFLADVSHNLRTPLSAILGWTEALQDGIVAGQESTYLEKIHSQTRLVAQKVARLLELSRWQSSQPLLHKRQTPLSEPLLQAVDAVAPAAEEANSQLKLSGDIHQMVWVDAERLRDVFQILLENAVEHAGAGVQIEVFVESPDDNGQLRLQVRDNGRGCAACSANGDTPHPGPPKGDTSVRGLGLSIARRLVEAHGGKFTWDSQVGQGTIATVSLPTAEPDSPSFPRAPSIPDALNLSEIREPDP